MIVNLEIKRFLPSVFFKSARDENENFSTSERFAKAAIVVSMGIQEREIRKGDHLINEPDLVINNQNGVEVTFASSETSESGIQTIKRYIEKVDGGYEITASEEEVIQSISKSLLKKSKKTYSINTSVFAISLEPLFNWYGELHNFNHPHTKRKRNAFFQKIYENYIHNKLFENIFILILTEFKSYVLFDIKKFCEGVDPHLVEIKSKKLENLPICEVTNFDIQEYSTLPGGSEFHYKIINVIGSPRKAK